MVQKGLTCAEPGSQPWLRRLRLASVSANSISRSGAPGDSESAACTDPAGGCVGDVNGDGVVSVEDLVDLILAWGPCTG